MTKVNMSFRGVEEETMRELKAEAAKEKKKLGDALSEAVEYWIHYRKLQKKKKGKFTDLKPISFGPGSKHSSTDIDKVVYG